MKQPSSPTSSPLKRFVSIAVTIGNVLLVLIVLIVLGALVLPYVRAASKPTPQTLPAAMVTVDWHDPESSQYCLACHRQVSPAVAGLDVERGHSQNVPLNEAQLSAVRQLGTVTGPGNRLICMSCHQLGNDTSDGYMLAAPLDDSELCQGCHPGHYARGTPHDLRLSAPDATNRLGQTVAARGPCSACHLAHSYALEIERSPLDPEGYCLPCHSTYGVAGAHARTTMDHPESRCRDCHDPHDMSHGEFLAQPIETLCLTCHPTYGDGLAGGMHPLGHMEDPVPQELLDAGAHVLDDPHQLTCIVCHDTHEASHRALLHITPDANKLCLTCHEDKLIAQAHIEVLPKHGQQPILNADQQAVVARWDNPIGPNGELLCTSCHRVHGAHPDTELLTFTPQYGDVCVACHPAEGTVFGTAHDLRTNHPNLPNDAGMTPIASGACSACHLSHRFPRQRVPSAADPGGQCNACHNPNACGREKLAGDPPHPETACHDCHDPHTRRVADFLKADHTELCVSCHNEPAALVGGPHDVSVVPDAWPKSSQSAKGLCLPCHVAHGGGGPGLFRMEMAADNLDGECLSCHADAGWDRSSTIAAIHPSHVAPEHLKADVALVTNADGEKRIGCRTCHDPHGGAQPKNLARVAHGQPSEELCLHCHDEKRLIRLTDHSFTALQQAGFETDSCKPCHAMHAMSEGTWGELLSPRFLMEQCELVSPDIGSCVPCLGCHRPDGPAPVRDVATHPEVITMNVYEPTEPGYLPLYDPGGHVDKQGQVTCRTCHVSHGRLDLLERLENQESLSDAQRHQIKAQIRPFVPPNICTTCHGPNARLLYLYFHDPGKREAVQVQVQ